MQKSQTIEPFSNVVSFLPHLRAIQDAYKRLGSNEVEQVKSRTDEIVVTEDKHSFSLTCAGTEPKIKDWFYNFTFIKTEWLNIGKVHSGFARNVDELLGTQFEEADQPKSLLNRCIEQAKQDKLIIVEGHSRGVPIAILVATELVAHGVHPDKILVVGCGGARVGNKRFARNYSEMLGHRTFILNGHSDPVRHLPPWGHTHGKVTMINLGGWYPKHRVKHYIRAINKLIR